MVEKKNKIERGNVGWNDFFGRPSNHSFGRERERERERESERAKVWEREILILAHNPRRRNNVASKKRKRPETDWLL